MAQAAPAPHRTHSFAKKTFHKPTYCHHCSDLLWGLIGQGYGCEGTRRACAPCASIPAPRAPSGTTSVMQRGPASGVRRPAPGVSGGSIRPRRRLPTLGALHARAGRARDVHLKFQGRRRRHGWSPHLGSAIPEESIFFAVKTWSGFHGTRARVVKKTWGRYVTHLQFYSDKDDPSLPAVDTGIPNSKTGHCLKTVAILKQALKRVYKLPHIKWIFLADDDTILGVQRLCEVLSCYRGGSDITILGERYGYGYGKKETAAKGYDYITGGGGTVLSIGAAQELSQCACTALTAPDDMTLGACASLRRNITATHSPLFHQARPQDYPREVLARDRPVSFHRHSTPDPLRVYATWFQHDDLALKRWRRDEL
ncbi:beta-1,3-glucosyltransferase-like [Ostrinia furnacalis]|uniref:beta-1,3-glucosyltransferase-like n=1 Tax=Ostrinia furnacalis TaxID=93504 RepID=UPI00103A3D5A|nr:beta-1,3-glucosyltransferase-like [Ostrinia furnacalis]